MNQVYAAIAMALLAISGLVVSNFLYDLGAPGTVSRRAAPVLGGAAFLVAVLWLDAWAAVALSGVLTLLILLLRVRFPSRPARSNAEPLDRGLG